MFNEFNDIFLREIFYDFCFFSNQIHDVHSICRLLVHDFNGDWFVWHYGSVKAVLDFAATAIAECLYDAVLVYVSFVLLILIHS